MSRSVFIMISAAFPEMMGFGVVRSRRALLVLLFSFASLLGVTSSSHLFAQERGATAAPAATPSAAKDDGKAQSDDEDDDDDDEDDKSLQPVRAGDLIGRDVIAPTESQDLLGHVRKLVKNADGDVTIVMDHGGLVGIGTHLVCVPAEALALTGTSLQAKGISPAEIDRLPVCDGSGSSVVDPELRFKMHITKPAH